MRLRELFEAPERTAAMAFGRMNPPTIGHAKLVDAVKAQEGDPYIFLSQSQKPKTDPLAFADKLRYAKFFFPEVTIGNPEVKTIIQALQKIDALGYDNLVYVAGSDRVPAFEELINKYNGVEYNFKSIKVVSAGERDPDADGAEGMSASKMRAAAEAGDLESFKQGVPNQEVADEMYAAVRQGMGIRDAVPAEGVQEENNILDPLRGAAAELFGKPEVSQIPPEEIALLQAMEKYKDDPAGLKDWIMKDLDIRRWLATDGSYLVDMVKSRIKGKPKTEDASEDEEDEFHRKLDKLVHKTFGHSSDEKKMSKAKESIGAAINFPGYEEKPKKNKKKEKEKSWLQKAKELIGLDESDVVIDPVQLRQYLRMLIDDAIDKEQDIDKLSKVLKILVGKEIKSRGKRYQITSEDVVSAFEASCKSRRKKKMRESDKKPGESIGEEKDLDDITLQRVLKFGAEMDMDKQRNPGVFQMVDNKTKALIARARAQAKRDRVTNVPSRAHDKDGVHKQGFKPVKFPKSNSMSNFKLADD